MASILLGAFTGTVLIWAITGFETPNHTWGGEAKMIAMLLCMVVYRLGLQVIVYRFYRTDVEKPSSTSH
jgi:hypothetical protein